MDAEALIATEWCIEAPTAEKAKEKIVSFLEDVLKSSKLFWKWEINEDFTVKVSPYDKDEYYADIDIYILSRREEDRDVINNSLHKLCNTRLDIERMGLIYKEDWY